MRNIKTWLATFVAVLVLAFTFAAPVGLTGCTSSQQRKAVNSLFTVGQTVDASYRSYLDLVVTGKIPTNSVPAVSKQYMLFQTAFNVATVAAAYNTNAPPSVDVLNAASQFNVLVTAAKGK